MLSRSGWPGRWTTIFALALFISGASGDAYGLHPCPHHNPSVADTPAESSPASAHGPADHHTTGSGHDADAPHGPCTCVGVCDGPTAAPLPGSAEPRVEHTGDVVVEIGSPTLVLRATCPTGRLLPYPNGPPGT